MKEGGESHETGIVPMDPADAASMARISALRARCFSTSGAEGDSPREAGGSGGWSGQDFSRVLASPGGFGFVAGVSSLGTPPPGLNKKQQAKPPRQRGLFSVVWPERIAKCLPSALIPKPVAPDSAVAFLRSP